MSVSSATWPDLAKRPFRRPVIRNYRAFGEVEAAGCRPISSSGAATSVTTVNPVETACYKLAASADITAKPNEGNLLIRTPVGERSWPPLDEGNVDMPRFVSYVALLGTLALGACVVPPPTGPNVIAMPPQGKDLGAFQQDDAVCRQYASQQIGGQSPSEAAQQSAINSAAVGTALGAVAGAMVGSASGNVGAGAAVGAGGGLLVGSAAGAGAAQASGANLQQRYDVAYAQCMASKGDAVSAVPSPPVYPYPAYAYPYPPAYAYPYPYAYPSVDFGYYWGVRGRR
jgi:hypothetical protein